MLFCLWFFFKLFRFSRLVGWLVDWLDSWLFGRLVGWWVGRLVGCLLVGYRLITGWVPVDYGLVGWLPVGHRSSGWLVTGRPVGWSVGWLLVGGPLSYHFIRGEPQTRGVLGRRSAALAR